MDNSSQNTEFLNNAFQLKDSSNTRIFLKHKLTQSSSSIALHRKFPPPPCPASQQCFTRETRCVWRSNRKQEGNLHRVSAAEKAASSGVQLDLATTW